MRKGKMGSAQGSDWGGKQTGSTKKMGSNYSEVEVKWPAEIKLYTEQGNVLQSILDLKQ